MADANKPKFRINFHIVVGIVFLIVLLLIIFKISNWGQKISFEEFFAEEELDPLKEYALDEMYPPHSPESIVDDGELQILFLGNDNLVADYGTPSNFTNIIEEQLDATVYNCGIEGSYLSVKNPSYNPDYPMDAFSLYWLTTLFTVDNNIPVDNAKLHLGDTLSDNTLDAIEQLSNIDFSKIDVIALYYDASDYYAGRWVLNNNEPENILYTCGSLTASVNLIKETYPHIRIILLSPAYSYAVAEDGTYVSSILNYTDSPLSTYVYSSAQQCSATATTFVDNLYGTINEDMAQDYLINEYILNEEGRKLVAGRFIDALEYFD